MTKLLDPKSLGLPPRTVLEEIDKTTLAIVINRKSRLIMADGKKILDKATSIKTARPDVQVLLKTGTPVCSKTLKLLKENNIKVIND